MQKKKTMTRRIFEAEVKYTPKKLVNYLCRAEDGTVCVDTERLIANQEDAAGFYYILTHQYASGWKNIENLTVYFEVEDDIVIGGAYDVCNKEKKSRRPIASANQNRAAYTYTIEDMQAIMNKIKSA